MKQLEEMRKMINKMMEASKVGINLNPEEILEVFGVNDPTEHAAEVQERWGESDAYRESQRRTRQYRKDTWVQIRREMDELNQRFISLLANDEPATGEAARNAAEDHRQQISRWFYPCSLDMHRNLAEMYVSDPRFKKTYEDMAEGLVQFVADAIKANTTRD